MYYNMYYNMHYDMPHNMQSNTRNINALQSCYLPTPVVSTSFIIIDMI